MSDKIQNRLDWLEEQIQKMQEQQDNGFDSPKLQKRLETFCNEYNTLLYGDQKNEKPE